MRYALTFTPDGNWSTTNTVIVEAGSIDDMENHLYQLLDLATDQMEESIGEIIGNHWYYYTNVNDIDIYTSDLPSPAKEDYERIEHDTTVEYAFGSMEGEDFRFEVSKENELQELERYARDFNVDEHTKLWINRMGQNGVPKTIAELLADSEWIKGRLLQLVEQVMRDKKLGKL